MFRINVWVVNYLYFPEDKSKYIPAAIEFAIFVVICVLVFRWIIRYSKKQEQQTKELEERILRERQVENKKDQQ